MFQDLIRKVLPGGSTGKAEPSARKAPAKKAAGKRVAAQAPVASPEGRAPSRPPRHRKAKPAEAEVRQERRRVDRGESEAGEAPGARPTGRMVFEVKHFAAMSDVPVYDVLLSGDGGDVEIRTEDRNDYVLLRLPGEDHALLIATAAKLKGKTGAMAIRERAASKGYKVDLATADQSVIGQLYKENSGKSSMEDRVEARNGRYQQDLDLLLQEAMARGTSDVHIEVRRHGARVRFRVNGQLVLKEDGSWGEDYARDFARVVYSVEAEEDSKDTSFSESRPQDAVLQRVIDGVELRVRIATIPAYPSGFDMVMRLLRIDAKASSDTKSLSDLGYSPEQVGLIDFMASEPVGVVVIAGTTGSGKSTSLQSIISGRIRDARGRVKVITVEDPPEYMIKGATQVPVVRRVNEGEGSGKAQFAAAIKAALRSDPDVLMVGEVRDKQSSELLQQAVQSGHQVFTTIHATSAFGIVPRLVALGIGRDVLGSPGFLSGLIYQALLPTLCPHCSIALTDFEPSGEQEERMMGRLSYLPGVKDANVRFRGEGCSHCDHGVTGRTVVSEVVRPDPEMLKLFRDGRDADAVEWWMKKRDNSGQVGNKSIYEHGVTKVLAGLVDPFDMEEKLGRITKHKVFEDGSLDIDEINELSGCAAIQTEPMSPEESSKLD